jgi:hypothetical protein
MDIISICHETPSYQGKVFNEIRKVFRFSQYSLRRYTEGKARVFAEKGRDDNIWAFNSILKFIRLLKERVDRKEITAVIQFVMFLVMVTILLCKLLGKFYSS